MVNPGSNDELIGVRTTLSCLTVTCLVLVYCAHKKCVSLGIFIMATMELPPIDSLPTIEALPTVNELPTIEELPTVSDLPAVEDLPMVSDLPGVGGLPSI